MTLAQRLNELAAANSEGLLNDDEYRLLRQDLFQRYSNGTTVPTETPLVPVAKHTRGPSASSSSTQRRIHPELFVDSPRPRTPPARPAKSSVTSSMSTFLRRATGRRSASTTSQDYTTTTNPSNGFQMNIPTPNLLKRSILPRILAKKGGDISSLRIDSSRSQAAFSSLPRRADTTSERNHSSYAPPKSPARSTHKGTRSLVTPPSPSPSAKFKHDIPSGMLNDIFNEDHLMTAKDIRQEIAAVEAEGNRLVDAFNGLEISTLIRHQKKDARRLPAVTPASYVVMMEGRDWRDRSNQFASASTSALSKPQRPTDSDSGSTRSGSSIQTTLSAAKSTYFSRKTRPRTPQHIPSPLIASPRHVSLDRKTSNSSISSQGTSLLSVSIGGRLGVATSAGSIKKSRSTGHLPLSALVEREAMGFSDAVGLGIGLGTGEEGTGTAESELADIRRRRAEVTGRYEGRLEYLRAKLKGAELHEKLLKR